MPAWSVNDGGELVVAVFRNTPGSGCAGFGADGSDPDAHTQEYAIRVPTGLSGAKSGAHARHSPSACFSSCSFFFSAPLLFSFPSLPLLVSPLLASFSPVLSPLLTHYVHFVFASRNRHSSH